MLPFLQSMADLIGIVGVVVILLSYFMLNIGQMRSSDMSYLVLNLVGSVFILVSLYFHWNLPSVIIEVAWIAISIIGMIRVITSRQPKG